MTGGSGPRRQRRAPSALKLALAALFALSLIRVGGILWTYRRDAEQYRQTAQSAVVSAAAPLASSKPSQLPFTVDWAALRERNSELTGWLYCEGTPINYPVMQSGDNVRYLQRGFDGEKNEAGALFFDCRNNVWKPDEQLIIYGHQMYDGSMFGTLTEYESPDYRDAHPVLYLLTPDGSYRAEVFASRLIEGSADLFDTGFESSADYDSFLRLARRQSYWETDVTVSAEDSILTLVTCSYYPYAEDPLFLVHCRLVPVE